MGTAETRAKNKYNAKAYDQIPLRVKAGEKEKIQARAQQKGMSLNAYIVSLIEKDMGDSKTDAQFSGYDL